MLAAQAIAQMAGDLCGAAALAASADAKAQWAVVWLCCHARVMLRIRCWLQTLVGCQPR